MSTIDVDELVSQAEEQGVTLAEMISRTMTPAQMKAMQKGLDAELAANYGKIEGFMHDVKVASLEELMGTQDHESYFALSGAHSRETELSDATP